ncbi:hypothetical protein PHYSODRAFT_490549, partial [Phytophthora sojae]
LKDQVCQIRENTVTARSRTTYQNSYCRFLVWLANNKVDLIAPEFAARLGDITAYSLQQLRAHIKEVINQEPPIAPLVFELLDAEVFVTWLVTLQRKTAVHSATPLSTRTEQEFNLFRDFGHTMSKTLESEQTTYVKGLKHKLDKDASTGASEIKTGKHPLMFDFTLPGKGFLMHTWSLPGISCAARPMPLGSDTRIWNGEAMHFRSTSRT